MEFQWQGTKVKLKGEDVMGNEHVTIKQLEALIDEQPITCFYHLEVVLSADKVEFSVELHPPLGWFSSIF